MGLKRRILVGITAFALVIAASLPLLSLPVSGKTDLSDKITARLASGNPLESLSSTAPAVQKPDWYFDTIIYYTVAENGATSGADILATLANETLNDPRGWSRLGVKFERVSSGGTLHLILAHPNLMPTYSSGCTVDWSCTVGNTVIINDARWSGASDSWNAAGGSLRDYRHMVVNHEVGHWLGHGHEFCSAAGALAPVMQQQSIDLMGCKFNPWPLDSELWTSRF